MLSAQELAELTEYAKANGRNWRSKLSREWLQGATILRAVRNKIGPSGIFRIRLKIV